MKRYHFSLIVLAIFVLALSACATEATATETVEESAVTATLAPTLVPTAALPTVEPTRIPALSVADDYCSPGSLSTDWCVCAKISSTGPIGALRNATQTEPHELRNNGIVERIEILVHVNGVPDHIEFYDWSTLLTVFDTTLHSGDVVCDAFKPTISRIHTDLEVLDYRGQP
jgi:hypothetical protein